MIPLPSGRGGHPTNVPVFGSRVNRRSVGPSAQSNATALFPIGFAGLKSHELFSSDAVADGPFTRPASGGTTAPVPSSNNVIENVLEKPPPAPAHPSLPASGTLIHLSLNALTFANPKACTGNVRKSISHEVGFKSVHAGAILGSPPRNSGMFALGPGAPAPKVT